MDERAVLVHVADRAPFRVGNVPIDITADSFISFVEAAVLKSEKRPRWILKIGDRVLGGGDFVIEDEVELVLQSENRSTYAAWCVAVVFIVAHIVPLMVGLLTWNVLYSIVCYVFLITFMIVVIHCVRPDSTVLQDVLSMKTEKQEHNYVVVEILLLFVKSCLPTFRLEHVLLQQ